MSILHENIWCIKLPKTRNCSIFLEDVKPALKKNAGEAGVVSSDDSTRLGSEEHLPVCVSKDFCYYKNKYMRRGLKFFTPVTWCGDKPIDFINATTIRKRTRSKNSEVRVHFRELFVLKQCYHGIVNYCHNFFEQSIWLTFFFLISRSCHNLSSIRCQAIRLKLKNKKRRGRSNRVRPKFEG